MPDESYWKERQEQKYLAGEKKVSEYYKGLEKAFEKAKSDIQRVINDFVVRYEIENGVTGGYAKAQQLLNKTELGELQDFIDMVKANMGDFNQDINNISYKARITRYEALLQQIDATLQQLYSIDYQVQGENILRDVYYDAYYQTWFNIDQYHGFHQEFAQVNAQTINELISYPFDGANFSTRLWKQKNHMLQQLTESITTMLIQGRSPITMAGDFSKKFKTKEYEAYRLLHTEGSFMIEQGSQAAYKEDGVEKYRWLATLDIKTCDECLALDGKSFDVEKAVVGVNMPPLHVFDRCTTVPIYEDSEDQDSRRLARDPITKKGYDVPADMKYPKWHKEFIESNPEAVITEKKWLNRYADKNQFGQYKQRLGSENIPKSFDEFQDIKYTDVTEYGILKAQVKGMTYYDRAVLNEPEITAQVKKIAESTGMDTAGIEYRLKSKNRYLQKISDNYSPDGNEYEVKDNVRYTYIANPEELTGKTLKAIDVYKDMGYNVLEVKNYWLNKHNPYNGINTTLRAPNGQLFEIQYHTSESYRVKDKMHDDYEKWSKMDKASTEAQELRRSMFIQSSDMTVPKGIDKVR